MRHQKKNNHLGRKASSRKALLCGLAKSLILNKDKRVFTTLAKAKALRKYLEPILTKVKKDTTHSRRIVFAYFQDKAPVKELFDGIAEKIFNRPGGYTRIIRMGRRTGDNAEMSMIELVDYNTLYKNKNVQRKNVRRGSNKKKIDEEVKQPENTTDTN